MSTPVVVVLDDYQHVARGSGPWPDLAGRAEVRFVSRHTDTEAELVQLLRGVQVVVAMRERTAFPAGVFRQLPELRLLVTTGMSNAAIDLAAAQAAGVTVTGTRSIEPATAELTWALILAVARRVVVEDTAVRAGHWQTTIGADLAGTTLGIIGLGRLGVRVARVATAFDMSVLAWSEHLTDERATAAGAHRAGTLTELLGASDIVTIHTRLSDRTRGLIGSAELAAMKPGALLVNTSRGPILDTPALVQALGSGQVGGAGLDVYDEEPLPPNSPLRTAPNLVLTPHIGYVTTASYTTYFDDVVEDIVAWLDGRPLRTLAQ